MVKFVATSFFTLVNFILRIFKRAVCCFKGRRRVSFEPVPLTNIGIVPNVNEGNGEGDLQTWNSWDETPTIVTTGKPPDPVQQKIELYRQQRITGSKENEDVEQNIDYFQDMTPKIVKQTKILLHEKQNEQYINSSLSLAPDPVFNSSELGTWEDCQSWEAQTDQDWDANDLIREKKKMDREKKLAEQQRKKFERESRGRNPTSIRIS